MLSDPQSSYIRRQYKAEAAVIWKGSFALNQEIIVPGTTCDLCSTIFAAATLIFVAISFSIATRRGQRKA